MPKAQKKKKKRETLAMCKVLSFENLNKKLRQPTAATTTPTSAAAAAAAASFATVATLKLINYSW